MNTFAIAAFFATLAAVSAGIVAPSAKILQGPSSKTTLVGPEGSIISSVAPGGQVITDEHPGIVAYAAPTIAHSVPVVAAAPAVVASPVVAHATLPLTAGVVVPAGHGIEGQYVHDYTETLYDDGSYKPHLY